VTQSLTSEDVSAANVDGHGVLAEMLISFVERQGVVTLSLTAEGVSVADADGHGVLAEMLVS